MSTTFVVIIEENKIVDLCESSLDEAVNLVYQYHYKAPEGIELVPVARRSGKSITWLNPLAPLLNPETKVYPIDNSHQGIYTISDILKYQEHD